MNRFAIILLIGLTALVAYYGFFPVTHSQTDMPDLVAELLSITPDPPVIGQPVVISISVRNLSTISSGPFKITLNLFFADGTEGSTCTWTISNLPAGQVFQTSTDKSEGECTQGNGGISSYTGSQFSIGLWADAPNDVTESNENNNTLSKTFGAGSTIPEAVPGAPTDLAADSLWITPDPAVKGQPVTIGFRIKNIGTASSSGPFSIDLTKTAMDNFSACRWQVPNLFPGQAFETNTDSPDVSCYQGEAGISSAQSPGFSLNLSADYYNAVPEPNELNNNLFKFVPVGSAATSTALPPPPPPALPSPFSLSLSVALTVNGKKTVDATPQDILKVSWGSSGFTSRDAICDFTNYPTGTIMATSTFGNQSIQYSSATPPETFNLGIICYNGKKTDVPLPPSASDFVTINISELIPSAKFSFGDRVETTADLNVRQTPSTSGTNLGTEPVGSTGVVIDGTPVYANGYWWWKVQYDSGRTGWSVENFLELSAAPPSPPPAPKIQVIGTGCYKGGGYNSQICLSYSFGPTFRADVSWNAFFTGTRYVNYLQIRDSQGRFVAGSGNVCNKEGPVSFSYDLPVNNNYRYEIWFADCIDSDACTGCGNDAAFSVGGPFGVFVLMTSPEYNSDIKINEGDGPILTDEQAFLKAKWGSEGFTSSDAFCTFHNYPFGSDELKKYDSTSTPSLAGVEKFQFSSSLRNSSDPNTVPLHLICFNGARTFSDSSTPPSGAFDTVVIKLLEPSEKFKIGDMVQTIANVNVRPSPEMSGDTPPYNILGSQTTGALGTVQFGPSYADGHWWWYVSFTNAPSGWVAEDYLVLAFEAPPTIPSAWPFGPELPTSGKATTTPIWYKTSTASYQLICQDSEGRTATSTKTISVE
ncbi:MAG: hypothetical protein A3G49_05920 [Candidatus Sungbacteria bacterium RIFCSPLOWO2_12_FULL_41_11]|uniref:SH3b domain-containing protein n=1 Tax=Candidatus Sungbacteria bacterium RIFCSPLOWO2_12_FULL_41_11 TaxID=1802286 RepID=A0A1G2LPA4_9BACT|nr:MAG: hypothetical protein A3G49_05920 [Candidatus Sungbacteria bacterium RIFCSPLOWO2_12_FULL_41_11]